jgi:hypothetical protein
MNISEVKFQPSSSVAEAIDRSASILHSVGVDPTQIAIWLLRQHSKFDEVYAGIYEDACELVEWATAQIQPPHLLERSSPVVSTTTLTATQIGQMLVERYPDITHPPSAQRINQALEKLEFHSRDDKKVWQLTKLGQQYGRILNVTDEQDRTRLQVRWLPTVIDRLAPLFCLS